MKIAVMGAKGFIGSTICQTLKKHHKITEITRNNYNIYKGCKFDVFINAAGNSKRYISERSPEIDFKANVIDTFNTLFDFHFKNYIYVSTIDIYKDNIDVYSLDKKIAEKVISLYSKKLNYSYTFLRCGSVIGKNMIKGQLFDIINNIPLFVTLDSCFQFISDKAIAENILYMIKKNKFLNIVDVFSKQRLSIKQIFKLLNKKILIGKSPKKVVYNIKPNNKTGFKLKKSTEYIIENFNALS